MRILFRRNAPRAVRQVGGISEGTPRDWDARPFAIKRIGRRGFLHGGPFRTATAHGHGSRRRCVWPRRRPRTEPPVAGSAMPVAIAGYRCRWIARQIRMAGLPVVRIGNAGLAAFVAFDQAVGDAGSCGGRRWPPWDRA